jgi:glycosyltransferase involved in cell wall biosynthesis/peptidoglycan/xylan/chitin deacetylase (PgdA/CDA1 family)/SAM-dependent methyltransferase
MSPAAPTVSVVIPCHNLGAYVDQAVQSVLDQTYPDFEIVLIDDGSTDPATRHLFTSYRRPHTRILRTENQGLAKTRNLGVREAAGRYVSFLDADDLLVPTFLEKTVALLESDSSLAFASCWLEGFGESQFLWTPSTCDFPHLLAEDTVCTAALTRREALVAAGGFDPDMPMPGYEDWDLAISLVERGFVGRIVPEVLFRYRIRGGSMSESCTSPENHARLLRWIVRKHADTYRRHLPGVLAVIEQRTIEMEGAPRAASTSRADSDERRRSAVVEETLRKLLGSRSWRASSGLRRARTRVKLARDSRKSAPPRVSVVLTCRDQGRDLPDAFRSVSLQTSRNDEVIIVDEGSTDPITLQVLDGYRSSGIAVLRADGRGTASARAVGLRSARAPYRFAMGADQTLESDCLPRAMETLDREPTVDFVCCGLRDSDTSGFTYAPRSADLSDVVGCRRYAFPVVRAAALEAVGGYDPEMKTAAAGDYDLVLRLAASGRRGTVLPDPLVNSHARRDPEGETLQPSYAVHAKHAAIFERHLEAAVVGLEEERRALQTYLEAVSVAAAAPPAEPRTSIDWGDLRRVDPVSAVWGIDRGLPVDRYYIARFLESRRGDIRGRVLEVKDSTYTGQYGGGVEAVDVVDIAPDNASANVIADLAEVGSLPGDRYDCFVLTQTIHIIYDVRSVLRNAYRALKPGGVLLATLPCVSRLDYESGLEGDFWRFTPASARRLFEEAFGEGNVEVEAFGNVLACSGFLYGLSAGELRREELDHSDPYFPLVLCIRATKRAGPDSRAAILLYHRIDRAARDRWRLCVSPENFASQLDQVCRRFQPVRLRDLAAGVRAGGVPHRGVALTFDDGYRDNVTRALPMLRERAAPATFFLSGDGAASGATFWWEVLDASLERMGLDEPAARALHSRLARAAESDRRRELDSLPAGSGPFPPRMSAQDAALLVEDQLADIGAHGWSHRSLADLPPDEQAREIDENVRGLESALGVNVTSFAYPFGGPVGTDTPQILARHGIDAACAIGTEPVTGRSNPLALPRLEVGDWDGEQLAARLERLFEQRAVER